MEKQNLTLGSLFDGSGGFSLGGILVGMEPVWSCEVEPFPIRVTEKRLPQVKHYGDICSLNGAEVPPVDVITGGFPCQSVSVAGKREGVKHISHGDGQTTRSGLFYEAVRVIKEMREATNGKYPRYFVVENVPGLFSSNGGEDFRSVLEEICKIKNPDASVPMSEGKWSKAGSIVGDGFSLCWRVLDAQYWGVPQRRARIFLVADFGGERAGDLLFESESVCGYSAEGFEAWKRTARNTEGGTGTAGCVCLNDQGGDFMDVSGEVSGTLRAQDHGHPPVVAAGFCTEHSAKARSIGYEEEKSPTLRARVVPAAIALEHHPTDSRIKIDETGTMQTLCSRMGTGGNNVPLVMTPEGPLVPYTLKIRCGKEGGGKGALVQENLSATLATNNDQTLFAPAEQTAFGISSDQSHAMLSDNPHAGIYEAKTSRTLDQGCNNPGCNQGGVAVVEKVYPIEGNGQRPSHKGDGWNESDASYTLNGTEQHGVAAPVYFTSKNSHMVDFKDDDKADTLVATGYKEPPAVAAEPYYIVRRLTPVECARLQGFPDWWCDGLGDPEPSDEEVAFWMDVFETHRKVITGAKKPKTEKQVRKWLSDPYLDSAAYRMYGNGVALPCVWFVLSAIVHNHQTSP